MKGDDKAHIAYADCFSGISGDMFLGALFDVGLDPEELRAAIGELGLEKFSLRSFRETRSGISATRVEITAETPYSSRTWRDIRELIQESGLAEKVRETSLLVFACLAEAEARIHGTPVEEVHFHEVGGLDSIVDIIGSVFGLYRLGIEKLVTSSLPMPRGWVRCRHGDLPLPAPAVCEILQGVPVYGVDYDQELVTPTGAALAKSLSSGFGEFPAMRIERTGYGAGSRTLADGRPNLLRLVIGRARHVAESREVEIIETNLDDWSPEFSSHLFEQLFALGALDVGLAPRHMKKGRLGFLLQVICDPARSLEIKNCIFLETTAIGLRFRRENRITLPRKTGTVPTPWGHVGAKLVETPAGWTIYPEHDDCLRVARQNGVPLQRVYGEVGRSSPETFTEKKE
ncbi:MAG: nickel pincer cofactor biosynthesis protein LarC [Deltaproteobacteria bacterium]|jgi:uncharacterized protein (TIGR00299 family) protein|nr:nickel pincer cofactor biosynthesis protein LarC [Deltaproteobacteria bacterium]